MEPTRILTDDDAVSPAIAIVLMVAIVVVLGAVVGTWAIGTGTENTGGQPAPSTRLGFSHDPAANEMTIEHEGGDTFDRASVEFNVVGGTTNVRNDFPNAKVTVGDRAVLSGVQTDHVVQVFWKPPDSEGKKHRVGQWTGPDAPT